MTSRSRHWRKAGWVIGAALWLAAAAPASSQEMPAPAPVPALESVQPVPPPSENRRLNPAFVVLLAGGLVVLGFVILALTGFFTPGQKNNSGPMNKS